MNRCSFWNYIRVIIDRILPHIGTNICQERGVFQVIRHARIHWYVICWKSYAQESSLTFLQFLPNKVRAAAKGTQQTYYFQFSTIVWTNVFIIIVCEVVFGLRVHSEVIEPDWSLWVRHVYNILGTHNKEFHSKTKTKLESC